MNVLGVVTDELEATLPLYVPVPSGDAEPVTAVIDTGFNGYLTRSRESGETCQPTA